MKRWLSLGGIFVIGAGALTLGELRKADAPVGPGSILNFIADTQRELTRLPTRALRLSDNEEIVAGEKLATRYAARLTPWMLDEDRLVEEYVDRIGRRIAAGAGRKLAYRFHYVPDQDLINAFALPGGHVFLGAGLFAKIKKEDELAAILGHEIAHVDLYHCAERLQVEVRLRNLPLGDLVALPVRVFEAGYTKVQELEADREGVRLTVGAGYSPLGAVRVFETMEHMRERYVVQARTPQGEISQVALETLHGYFRSHPLPEQRKQQVEAMIRRLSWTKRTELRPLEVKIKTTAEEVSAHTR
jgi:predicted Zn-dependent protease